MPSSSFIASLHLDPGEPAERDLVIGFYDVAFYTKWSASRRPLEVFRLFADYFIHSGQLIDLSGGYFVKAIGDSGLFVYPGATDDQIDNAIGSSLNLHCEVDSWIRAGASGCRVKMQLNWGTVACGYVGAAADKRFDIYGSVVNETALMRPDHFALADTLHRRASKSIQGQFIKSPTGIWELIT